MTDNLLFIRWLLAVLSAYRLTRLLTLEAGPAFVLAWLRARVSERSELLGTLLECPLCLGVWISALLTPALFLPYPLAEIILAPLAIAGGQCALQLFTDNSSEGGAT